MKKFHTLLFVLSFGMITQLNAQSAHMQAVRNHEHVHRQFQNMTMMLMGGQNAMKYQGKYKFNIVTLNGDTIFNNKKTKVVFNKPIKEIIIRNNKAQDIYTPNLTKEIYLNKKGRTIKGIVHYESWIFNTYSSKDFKLYSYFPEEGVSYAEFYQLNDDSIKMITIESVGKLVAGNIKAEKALEKKDIHKALYIYI